MKRITVYLANGLVYCRVLYEKKSKQLNIIFAQFIAVPFVVNFFSIQFWFIFQSLLLKLQQLRVFLFDRNIKFISTLR